MWTSTYMTRTAAGHPNRACLGTIDPMAFYINIFLIWYHPLFIVNGLFSGLSWLFWEFTNVSVTMEMRAGRGRIREIKHFPVCQLHNLCTINEWKSSGKWSYDTKLCVYCARQSIVSLTSSEHPSIFYDFELITLWMLHKKSSVILYLPQVEKQLISSTSVVPCEFYTISSGFTSVERFTRLNINTNRDNL